MYTRRDFSWFRSGTSLNSVITEAHFSSKKSLPNRPKVRALWANWDCEGLRLIGNSLLWAERFGDLTADHKVLNEGSESRHNHRFSIVVQDSVSKRIQSYPCKTKTSQEREKKMRTFVEPSEKLKVIYTDNVLEFFKLCEDFSWNRWKSGTQNKRRYFTPHLSETNGIAGRTECRIKERRRIVPILLGCLNAKSMCEMFQTYRQMGKHLPCARRFGEPPQGPIIPFRAMVEYSSISAKRPVEAPPTWRGGLAMNVPSVRIGCGENLEGRNVGCRNWRVSKLDVSEIKIMVRLRGERKWMDYDWCKPLTKEGFAHTGIVDDHEEIKMTVNKLDHIIGKPWDRCCRRNLHRKEHNFSDNTVFIWFSKGAVREEIEYCLNNKKSLLCTNYSGTLWWYSFQQKWWKTHVFRTIGRSMCFTQKFVEFSTHFWEWNTTGMKRELTKLDKQSSSHLWVHPVSRWRETSGWLHCSSESILQNYGNTIKM